jgi:hypothetical protein
LPLNNNYKKPADNQVAISWKRIILFHCPLDGEQFIISIADGLFLTSLPLHHYYCLYMGLDSLLILQWQKGKGVKG